MAERWIVLTIVRLKSATFRAAALFACVGANPASAAFEQMQIEQVVGGVGARIDQQAVQLRMRAAGQNGIEPARIRAWDNTGSNPVLLLDFTTNVANGNLGDRVLVVSSTFAAAYGAGDFVMTNPIPPSYLAAGRLTYEDDFGVVYWSLSWGGSLYTGPNAGSMLNDSDGNFGPPFGSRLPTSTAAALAFTGPAGAMSTGNLADYAITAGAASFTTNAGVPRPLPSEVIFGDGFESGPSCPSGVAWDETSGEVVLCCDRPADGALVDLVPGATVSIRGSALGLSDVHVNGTPVAVAGDHTFSATVTGRHGLNFVELSATDGVGATRAGLCAFLGAERWAAEGAQFDDALLFRLEPPGFQKLKTACATWFSGPSLPQNLDSALAASIGHTVIGDCGDPFGTCADIQYLSVSAVLRPPPAGLVISVDEAEETLNVAARYDISVHLRASGRDFGIPHGPITGDALFANTLASVHIDLGIDPVTGLPVVSAGLADVVNLSAADWSQFKGLGSNIRSLMVSFVEPELSAGLVTEVLGGAAGLFEGLFAGLDVTLPAAGFSVGRLDGTGDVTVAFGRWHALDLRNNGMTLPTGLRVTAPLPPPNAAGLVPLPLLGNPDIPSRADDAWSAVHAGVFNQVLQALWRADLFEGTVDGADLGTGLPPGTSLSVELRTMPIVTGFAPSGLDIGALDLVVTHPDLPPGLRVAVGARIGAQGSLLAGDLVFGDIAPDELHLSTGAVNLDPASQATLQDLVERLLVKLAGIALNDSLPVLPEAVFTIPPSLGPYGLPVGSRLIVPSTSVVMDTHRVIWDGSMSPPTP